MIAGTVFFFFFLETTALLGDILIKVSNNLCVCVCVQHCSSFNFADVLL